MEIKLNHKDYRFYLKCSFSNKITDFLLKIQLSKEKLFFRNYVFFRNIFLEGNVFKTLHRTMRITPSRAGASMARYASG
tara:strand:+ start:460 stop:696 length:237 start_codon:yes stop_codon:yes gene_type:complete